MWGMALIVVLILMIFMGAKGAGTRYIHVPEGESWRKVYRDTVVYPKKKRELTAPSRTMFWFGAAFLVVAVLLVLFL